MDPSSKWTFTLGGWVGGICNGVSPEAKVEGGIEMGPENQLGLANSGLLLLKLDSENRPPPPRWYFATRGVQSRFWSSSWGICKNKNTTHSHLLFFSYSSSSFPNILTYMSIVFTLC